MFVAAADDRAVDEALESGADALCFDIAGESGPALEKMARRIAMLRSRAAAPLIFVTTADVDDNAAEARLDAFSVLTPDGLVLQNCGDGRAVRRLGALLAVKEAETGRPDGSTHIIAMAAGTAASIFELGTFAQAGRRLIALAWNADGLAAHLGVEEHRDNTDASAPPVLLARNLLLFAARAANVMALDSARPGADVQTFRRGCETARGNGFDGGWTRDAAAVATLNAVFA